MAERADRTIDLRGLTCLMPVVRTRVAMDLMQPGQVLRVIASDHSVRRDLEVWARASGNELLNEEEEPDGGMSLYLRKGKGADQG